MPLATLTKLRLNLLGKKYRIKKSGYLDEKGMAVTEHIPGSIVEVYLLKVARLVIEINTLIVLA